MGIQGRAGLRGGNGNLRSWLSDAFANLDTNPSDSTIWAPIVKPIVSAVGSVFDDPNLGNQVQQFGAGLNSIVLPTPAPEKKPAVYSPYSTPPTSATPTLDPTAPVQPLDEVGSPVSTPGTTSTGTNTAYVGLGFLLVLGGWWIFKGQKEHARSEA
jgi:hypothetical protein